MQSIQLDWYILAKKYSDNKDLIESYWEELYKQYTGAKRFYHNLSHISNLLRQAHSVIEHIRDLDILCFAIWYHDVIYEPERSDNEVRSADLAVARLRSFNLSAQQLDYCHYLIMATKQHKVDDEEEVNLLLDMVVSILGAEESAYEEYAQQIRKEYEVFPDTIYMPGRKKVLQHFLEMERIFKTDLYSNRLEQNARQNLKKELEQL